MTTFLKLLLAGTIGQLGALFLFIQVAKTDWAAGGKPVVIGAFGVAMAAIVWKAVRSFRLRTLALFCVALTLVAIVSLQMLGFLAYPGLVKDVGFESTENVGLVLSQATAVFATLFGMSILLLLFNKVLNYFKSSLQKSNLDKRDNQSVSRT